MTSLPRDWASECALLHHRDLSSVGEIDGRTLLFVSFPIDWVRTLVHRDRTAIANVCFQRRARSIGIERHSHHAHEYQWNQSSPSSLDGHQSTARIRSVVFEPRNNSTMSLRQSSFVETAENGSSELWFRADPRLRNDVSVPCQPCSFSHASIWAALWPSWINFPKQPYGKANVSSAFLFESINRQRDKSFLRPSAMPCNMFVPMLANARVCSESQVWSRKSIVFEDKSRRATTRQRWKRSSSMSINRSSLLTSFGSISGNSRNVSFRLFSRVSFAIWWKVTLTLTTISEMPSSLSRCHTRRTDLGDTLHVLALARWESRSLGKYSSISPRRLHPLGKQSGRSSRLASESIFDLFLQTTCRSLARIFLPSVFQSYYDVRPTSTKFLWWKRKKEKSDAIQQENERLTLEHCLMTMILNIDLLCRVRETLSARHHHRSHLRK